MNVIDDRMKWNFRLRTVIVALFVLCVLLVSQGAVAAPTPGSNACNSTDAICNICVNNDTGNFPDPTSVGTTDLGGYMIGQIFAIINTVLAKIEKTFYSGIVNNAGFQQIVGVAFIMYLTFFGVMLTFNLASYRSGEVMNRLIKVAIVYTLTQPAGWTYFSGVIQHPIIGGINQLIGYMANTTTVSGGGACVTPPAFSGNSVMSTGTTGSTIQVTLKSGPMAMLFGPMTCVFAGRFMAGIAALTTTGFYGWVLGLLLLWGLVEFSFMIMGAIATYVKAIVGLTFLFGIAPLFFAFYLFEKTRALTEGWMGMVIAFALQPVMLFAFLAFYAGIIGVAVDKIFMDSGGNPTNICYVPFYSMPGMLDVYLWRFKNAANAAGGQWLPGGGTAGSSGMGVLPSPARILDVFYFLSLCHIGKSFSRYIGELSTRLAGSSGGGVTSGEQVQSWLSSTLTGGQGVGNMAKSGASKASSTFGRMLGKRPPGGPPGG